MCRTVAVSLGGLIVATLASYSVSAAGYTASIDNTAVARDSSIAIGSRTSAEGTASIAIGLNTTTKDYHTDGAIAIGSRTSTNGTGSIAMGLNTKAEERYTLAVGTGAVANRQSSMAIGVNAKANHYLATAIGVEAVAKGRQSFSIGKSAVSTGENNIAIGTEALSGGRENAIAIGTKAVTKGERGIAIGTEIESTGNGVAIGMKSSAYYGAIALGEESVATGPSAIAIGRESNAPEYASLAIGSTAKALGQGATAVGVASNAKGASASAFGSGSSANGGGSLALGGATANGDRSIAIGELNGANGTDSILIGNQSYTFVDRAILLGTSSQVGGKDAVAIGNINSVHTNKGIGIGYNNYVWDASDSGSLAIGAGNRLGRHVDSGKNNGAIGNHNSIVGTDTYVMGSQITSTQDSAVVLGANSADRAFTKELSAHIDGVTFGNFAGGKTVVGVVSVGAENRERQIINVAPGKIASDSTDAINGSQLYSAMNHVMSSARTTKVVGGTNIASVTKSVGANGQDSYTINANGASVTAGSRSVTVTPSTDMTTNITNYTVGLTSQAEQRLEQVDRNTINIQHNTNIINNHNERINQLSGEIKDVGAMSAALSGLKPIQYDPLEPTQIMASIGAYRSNTAMALGVAHFKNESTMFHMGASYSGNNDLMANVGVTWKLGNRASETSIQDRYRKGPISSIYTLQNEDSAIIEQNNKLAEENAKLHNQLFEQQVEINTMKHKLARQEAQIESILAEMRANRTS